ncbi:MAG: RNA-directed DNA polymerase (Reverse transcriptase), partial [Candidatus Cloacimonetes bacterium]|nr:RNA-directed DNA polymerase (Reverse transcriptase) [Candidatus Cloacimonadota bacterium]
VYLNEADHFIRQQGIKHYIRYMDDMLLFSDSSEHLKDTLNRLEKFLCDVLKLTIKERSVQINYCKRGIPFLGFRIFPDIIRVQNVNIKRMKQKIKEKEYLFKKAYISEETLNDSVQSTIAYIETGNTFKLRERIWG